MEDILQKILETKKAEIRAMKGSFAVTSGEVVQQHSFLKRLKQKDEIAIIAEFKRASPSKGDINLTLNPINRVKEYCLAGADALSILTDSTYFKGSMNDIEQVRNHIKVPILCKDFMIDTIQIDQAKQSGADIVLLILAALNDNKLIELYEYATKQGLEVLMEVHNEEEARRALSTTNTLIGINNRDLRTFKTDLSVTEKLAPMIKKEGRFVISESGIKTADDVQKLSIVGADGILVGESFMKSSHPAELIQSMKIPRSIGYLR